MGERGMASLGELLCNHTDELVHRWYERWLQEGPATPGMTEAAIKDHLAVQLQAIGDSLRERGTAESPRQLWEQPGRLDPEQRVRDEEPIEEVVREYAYVIEAVRLWLDERNEQVSVQDYSFFSIAIFELAAESARRFARYQSEQVARERSEYVAGIAHQWLSYEFDERSASADKVAVITQYESTGTGATLDEARSGC